MNIKKLFEMQKDLDDRIIKEHGLEGKDLLPDTILALQVEIGECANEWRGFKHWSNRQTPKMYPLEICSYCDEEVSYTRPSPFMADAGADMCEDCWNGTQKEYAASNDEHIGDFKDYPHFPEKKPQKLLEEYGDCVHLFLSLAHSIEIPEDELDLYDSKIEGCTASVFTDIITAVGLIETDTTAFDDAWKSFLLLGTERLGFTFEQIEAAYMDKNKTNHERQANGY